MRLAMSGARHSATRRPGRSASGGVVVRILGGVWGLVFELAEKRFPQNFLYYVCAFLFGAIVPVLVLWFVVMPLMGGVIASGWNVQRMAIQMLIHGRYGLGVGILVRAFSRS